MVLSESHSVTEANASDAWIDAGVVLKAHGVRGELRGVLDVPLTVLQGVDCVRLVPRQGLPQVMTVVGARNADRSVLVTFKEVTDRDVAMLWHGARLQLRVGDVPEPEAGEYYVYELHGAQVQDEAGDSLGTVREVADNAGQALLVLEGPQGELLLPLVPATLRHFDRQARLLTVFVPPGLWDA